MRAPRKIKDSASPFQGRSWTSRQKRALLVIGFIVVGVGALILTHAATPTSTLEPENGSVSSPAIPFSDATASGSGGVRFGSSSVRRFFADDASWNKTITQMGGEFTQLKSFAYRLWDYGGGTQNGSPPGNIYLDFKDYSVPIYDAATATTTARVFQVIWSQNQQSFSFSGMKQGDTIPWNPAWLPGTGNDRILQIVNYTTGKVYGLWGVGENKANCIDRNIFGIVALDGPNAKAGYNENDGSHMCIAAIQTYSNLWTANDSTTSPDRGMGINKLALVIRADEVAKGNATNGSVGHAIPLTTANPMFGAGVDTPGVIPPTYNGTTLTAQGSDPLGNGMVNPKNDPLQPGAGTTKGFYLKPATRLEHEFGYTGGTLAFGGVTLTTPDNAERAKTNPSGMRFGLTLSDADITAWLDARGYTGVKRQTAATLARTWRDYGAVIAETGGNGIGIETDGVIDPISRAKWGQLGITYNSSAMTAEIDFTGLITRDRLYVVKTPQ